MSYLCSLRMVQDGEESGNKRRIDDLCVFRHDVLFVAKDSLFSPQFSHGFGTFKPV